jgi:hypothetical protein
MEAENKWLWQPWAFAGFDENVLKLRTEVAELQLRFWPCPAIKLRVSGEAWKDASHLGNGFLALSGYYLKAQGLGLRLSGVRPLEAYLGERCDARCDVLPATNLSVVDALTAVIDAEGQFRFLFDLWVRDADRAWKMTSALDLAVACIPRRIRRRLPYFEGSPWALLRLAGTWREVRDLMCLNPMLLNMWLRRGNGDYDLFEKDVIPSLRLKQRKQFALCCEGDEDQSCVNILRKIPLEQMCWVPDHLVRLLPSISRMRSSFGILSISAW